MHGPRVRPPYRGQVSGSHTDRGEMAVLTAEFASLQAENARLLRLLKLSRREAAPPGPTQTGFFEAPPGAVHAGSSPEVKVAFFGALFAARTDLYAVHWENARTGQKGWLPAVRGGWRKGLPHAERDYLPLTWSALARPAAAPGPAVVHSYCRRWSALERESKARAVSRSVLWWTPGRMSAWACSTGRPAVWVCRNCRRVGPARQEPCQSGGPHPADRVVPHPGGVPTPAGTRQEGITCARPPATKYRYGKHSD
jgi:hypothetical protein